MFGSLWREESKRNGLRRKCQKYRFRRWALILFSSFIVSLFLFFFALYAKTRPTWSLDTTEHRLPTDYPRYLCVFVRCSRSSARAIMPTVKLSRCRRKSSNFPPKLKPRRRGTRRCRPLRWTTKWSSIRAKKTAIFNSSTPERRFTPALKYSIVLPGECSRSFFFFFSSANVWSQVLRGGDGMAGFAVRHPNGQIVHPYQWKASSDYQDQESTGGYYSVCIDNQFSKFAAKLVNLYITVIRSVAYPL